MIGNETSTGPSDETADPFNGTHSLINELAEVTPASGSAGARMHRTNPQDPEHIAALDAYRSENPSEDETIYQASVLTEIDRLSKIPGQEEALEASRAK